MTKKWPGLFLVQSSIPLSQGWLDLRSVKNLADRRTKAAPRNCLGDFFRLHFALSQWCRVPRAHRRVVIVRRSSVGGGVELSSSSPSSESDDCWGSKDPPPVRLV